MPVVGGILAGIALLISALSLVFVPKEIRLALAAVTFPGAVVAAVTWIGFRTEASLVATLAAILLALLWKVSLIRFHDSWLRADPRMTTAQGIAWREGRNLVGPGLMHGRLAKS